MREFQNASEMVWMNPPPKKSLIESKSGFTCPSQSGRTIAQYARQGLEIQACQLQLIFGCHCLPACGVIALVLISWQICRGPTGTFGLIFTVVDDQQILGVVREQFFEQR